MEPKRYFPGFLVVFEGIDGAGKTTQAHFLQSNLQERGLKVIRTKEPTDKPYGQILRDSAATGRLSAEEEADTFIKDRQQHVNEVIAPELEAGKIVIVDRYYFSTAAYQGARGLPVEKLIDENERFAPEPDLLFLLDVEPKIGLQRIRLRGDRANHFERTETLKKAREIFLSIKKPYRCVVDALKTADEIKFVVLREFSARYADAIAASGLNPKEQLNSALRLFGGSPIN